MKVNEIYNENCLDTMARMEDNFIDLTITSPPYDNLRTYNGYSFDFENIAKELFRVTKEGGVVVWVVGDATTKGSETGTSFRQALYFMECGFNLHDTMIWEKSSFIPLTHNRYEQCFEYMFIFSKGKPDKFNPIKEICKFGGKKSTGSFRHDLNNLTERNGNVVNKYKIHKNIVIFPVTKKAKGHPAAFPEELSEWHIKSWSNEENLVYDCFMGSGTTAKMSILNNRNYIGSEISEEYCNISNERLT
tara:strand:- start:42 stop:782 length:741 start_codon:yes stop_codon:yes gene_type:complete